MSVKTNLDLQLPPDVVGRVDVGRILRELETLENFLKTASIRSPEVSSKLPKTSRMLDELLQINKLKALETSDRKKLVGFLETVKTKSPILHISFSADPPAAFVQKLTAWLRQEIHPLVLVQIGLQPAIGAGTIVRTPNKQFDFSLRKRFSGQKDILLKKLRDSAQRAEHEIQSPVQET